MQISTAAAEANYFSSMLVKAIWSINFPNPGIVASTIAVDGGKHGYKGVEIFQEYRFEQGKSG